MKQRFRVTIIFDYEADSRHYDSRTPQEMAQIDKSGYEDSPEVLMEILERTAYTLSVVPVSEVPDQ